jgi:hypothetical protein
MSNTTRIVSLTVFTLALTLAACTDSGAPGAGGGGGGGGVSSSNEEKYTQAIASINKTWKVMETKKEKDSTIIRVEVDDNVMFADGKKAAEAIQKADPKFNGYVEFFNGQLGMVIRKVEIFPAT